MLELLEVVVVLVVVLALVEVVVVVVVLGELVDVVVAEVVVVVVSEGQTQGGREHVHGN